MSRKLHSFTSIEIKNLSMFAEGGTSFFENQSVKFPTGKFIVFHGPTGSGKSTILRLICGLTSPHYGDVLINQLSVNEFSFEEFIPYRLNMGFSFDTGGLLHNKTLLENLLLPIQYHPDLKTPESVERIKELLHRFGLSSSSDLRPSAAPGSHRKMAIVLRAFVLKPELLLLDEPTVGLPASLRHELKTFIIEERQKGTVKHMFVVSGDREFTDELIDVEVKIQNKEFLMTSLSNQKVVPSCA